MVKLGFPAAALAALVVCLILVSGCTEQKGGSQPPASTMTIATRQPTTPVPETPMPIPTGTAPNPLTPGVTPAWTPGTVSQAGTAILIKGTVIGLKSVRGPFIDAIQFTAVKAPQAEPVNFELENTQIIITESGRQSGTNYQILSGDENGDHILDEGESFALLVPIPPPYEIYPGQEFTMTIQNPPHAQVVVTTRAPPVLTDSMILARAPQ
jgi:hypothetical protein